MAIKSNRVEFNDDEYQNLPVGSHSPCLLTAVERREPTEANLRNWPDLKPSWCFRFTLWQPGAEYHRHTAVRYCNQSKSRKSTLFQFVMDLNGGNEPKSFGPEDFTGGWFATEVCTKSGQSERLHVESADPIDPPNGAETAVAELMKKQRGGDIPF